MKKVLILSFLLQIFFHISLAQDSSTSPTTTSSVSLTPQMSASAVSSLYSVLATSSPQQPGNGPEPGDVGSSASDGDSNAGASGTDSSSYSISKGGLIAIIVCASAICIFGAVSAVLFYLAKKRNWQLREKMRRSARRVATALTPRRSAFPKDALKVSKNSKSKRSHKAMSKIEEVPTSPDLKNADIEKANGKVTAFDMEEPPKKSGWARKLGR